MKAYGQFRFCYLDEMSFVILTEKRIQRRAERLEQAESRHAALELQARRELLPEATNAQKAHSSNAS